ncbi:hypothetical protein PanWU01x14_369900 [Parasponia andersonii]|uniref:Uncharacterized protein n=1 Tax=Parasponia andersonii TaxID=3476 RepID=A0A2P5A4G3_PARAD|nr:hypothetical protein PanWU01x14_369900 [Parasponia andersonii]
MEEKERKVSPAEKVDRIGEVAGDRGKQESGDGDGSSSSFQQNSSPDVDDDDDDLRTDLMGIRNSTGGIVLSRMWD